MYVEEGHPRSQGLAVRIPTYLRPASQVAKTEEADKLPSTYKRTNATFVLEHPDTLIT
jgi:hypothetical protein